MFWNVFEISQELIRYFLQIAYLGTRFHGWQIQENAHTVQQELENALSTLLRSSIKIVGSGRTDTGVHASAQMAHFDLEETLDLQKTVHRLNSFLPKGTYLLLCISQI